MRGRKRWYKKSGRKNLFQFYVKNESVLER
jgi:hypothetical protein